MLGKLIKHEFKATSRFMFLLYGLLLAVSFIMIFVIKINSGDGIFNIGTRFGSFSVAGGGIIVNIMTAFFVFAYIVLITAAVSAMFFYAINRFASNLLGDEGYLMHTLPVSAGKNILAKGIVSVVWTLLGGAAAVLSVFICCFGLVDISEIGGFFAGIRDLIAASFKFIRNMSGDDIISVLNMLGFMAELILYIIASLMNGYMKIFASMSIGYSFGKHRAAASVGVFVLFGLIISNISAVLVSIISATGVLNLSGFPHFFICGIAVMNALTAVGYYAIASHFINNRLNLQ